MFERACQDVAFAVDRACGEGFVDGAACRRLPLQPEAAGGIALGVDIDQQRLVSGERQRRGEVDRGGGSAAARLIAVVVFPTPPFWLVTVITFAVNDFGAVCGAVVELNSGGSMGCSGI
jgi:hypothetical protein